MEIEITKEDTAELLGSMRRFLREELEIELSELQSTQLLRYCLTEIAPFAYNRGVSDAENFLRARLEDVASACFEPPLTYWTKGKRS